MNIFLETDTMTKDEEAVEAAPEELLEEEKEGDEERDLKKLKQRKPPSDGPCKRCGQNKPINRLMLCYPCWVKVQLEKQGWKEGEPHPDECGCEGLSGHQRLSDGN